VVSVREVIADLRPAWISSPVHVGLASASFDVTTPCQKNDIKRDGMRAKVTLSYLCLYVIQSAVCLSS
jgi:hypothetical protein